LHISMMKHRTNLKISTADSEVIKTRVLYLCENLYSLSYIHIRFTIGQNFCHARCLRFEKRCEVRDLFKMAFQSFRLPRATCFCSSDYNWRM
jgi:hypothetical protein